MNGIRAVLTCAVLLGGAVPVTAQQRPDFTGTWERVWASDAQRATSVATRGDAAFETGDMSDGWGWGSPVTITQRRDSLLIEYVFFAPYDLQPPIRLAYALDGSESRNTIMIGHAAATQRARVQLRDASLAIIATYPLPAGVTGRGASTDVRQTLSLDGSRRLVVETIRAGADTTRTIYTRR